MFLNVRVNWYFIEKPYEPQRDRFMFWLQQTSSCASLSCVGFNTPSVIRWPMESIKHQHPNATLFRINCEHSQFPEGVREKAFSFAMNDGTVKRYPSRDMR